MIAYPNFSYSLRQENLMSSHPSIKIRPLLTVEEITVIANIQLDSWQATFCNEKLGSAIHSAFISAFERRWSQKIERGYQILVIEAANEIVGFVGFCLFSDSSNLSEICDIHVTPSARIHGYGKLLCDAALAEIKKAGFKGASIWLFEDSNTTKNFYEDLGFASTAAFKTNELGNGVTSRQVEYQITV
jgi:L-amino acid N-acyltransferase YncA